MQLLLDVLKQNGFPKVINYLQSGNLILTYSDKKELLEQTIHDLVESHFKLDIPVLAVEEKFLSEIVQQNPYVDVDQKMLYVVFFFDQPSIENVNSFKETFYENEYFQLNDQFAYLHVPNGFGKAKMNNNFFENKLKIKATTRNWRSVNKLLELVKNI